MPALVKYERKPLTNAQLFALRTYIRRKRLKDGDVSTNGVENIHENDKQEESYGSVPQAISDTPITPPAPTAQEIHKQKERSLQDIGEQLKELEHVLDGLKQKKHELFEEFKSQLNSETKSKKQAEERERQVHGFPPPFMGQSTGQVGLMNVSPYRSGLIGMKRPKSPSPPLVQLYSPGSSSTLQPSYDSPRAHHPAQTAGTLLGQGDMPRSTFGQQINFSSRDPRQIAHGSQENPRPPLSSQPAGSHYAGTQERQFLDSRHLQDRHLPSNFGNPQSSGQGATGAPNRPRQSQTNHPPLLQQNAFSGQQQAVANSTDGGFTGVGSFAKERTGFNTPDSHRLQGYVKRGGHPPNRSSRYY